MLFLLFQVSSDLHHETYKSAIVEQGHFPNCIQDRYHILQHCFSHTQGIYLQLISSSQYSILFCLKYVHACYLQLIQILPDICSHLHQDFTKQIFPSPFFNVESGFIFHRKTNSPDPVFHCTFCYDFFSCLFQFFC